MPIESEQSRKLTRRRLIAGFLGTGAVVVLANTNSDYILGIFDSLAKGKTEATDEMLEAIAQFRDASGERALTGITVKGILHSNGKFEEPDFFPKPTPFGSKPIAKLSIGSTIDKAIVVLGTDPAFPGDLRKTVRYIASYNPQNHEQFGFFLAKYAQGERIDAVVPFILTVNAPLGVKAS